MRRCLFAILALGVTACRPMSPVPGQPLVSALLAALVEERPFRLRLSPRERFAPCTDTTRAILDAIGCRRMSDDGVARLAELSAEVGRALRASPDIDALWASALLEIVVGDPDGRRADRAVGRLREVVARDSALVLARHHLAIAYLVRGAARDDPRDLYAAVDEIERAQMQDSASAMAAYNRGVVLSLLGLRRAAVDAWERAQVIEEEAAWRSESRHDVSLLHASPRPGRDGEGMQYRAQAARALAMDTLLPRWARAVVASQPGAADQLRDSVAAIGRLLLRRSGDSSLSRIARELEGNPRPVAVAVIEYLDGQRLYRQTQYGRAAPRLAASSTALTRAGSRTLGDWVDVTRAATAMATRRHDLAADVLDSVAQRAATRHDLVLMAMSSWAGSIAHARAGRTDESLARASRAESLFQRVGEPLNASIMAMLRSDVEHQAGRTLEAANSASRGFRSAADLGGEVRYEDLLGMGQQQNDAGRVYAARRLLMEAVSVAQRSQRPKDAPEALSRLAVVQARIGDAMGAQASIARARALSPQVDDAAMRSRLVAELDRAEARLQATANPREATGHANAALAYFGASPPEASGLHGLAGEIALRLADTARAESELTRAVAAARRMLPEAAPAAARQLMQQVREAHRTAIRIALARGDTARAWHLVVDLPSLERGAPATTGARRLETGEAELRLVVSSGEVLSWVRTPTSRTLHRWSVAEPELRQRLSRFLNAWRLQEDTAGLRVLGRAWYRDLIGGSAAALRGVTTLRVHADGVLWDLAVAALVDEAGEYVGDRMTVYHVVPSQRKRGAPVGRTGGALLVSNPAWRREEHPGLEPLRSTDEEVQQVAAGATSKLILARASATKSALLAQLPLRDLFYFAGHSRVVVDDPMRSHLVLAAGATFGEGVLSALEIASLNLRGLRRVILSSCGRTRDDDAALGSGNPIAWAYLDAGVTIVEATNRELDDREPLAGYPSHGSRFRYAASSQ